MSVKRFYKFIAIFAVSMGLGFLAYNNVATKNPHYESTPFSHKGQATDSFVRLLGLAGIRIQNDPLAPDANWPAAKLTLPSRSLEEINKAIQGKKDPVITWIIPGKRWQTNGLGYLTLTPEQAMAILDFILKDLKFDQAMKPQQTEYAGILFLGSSLEDVRDRLKFLNTCLEQRKYVFNKVYILTGTRALDLSIGETPESLLDPKGSIAVRSDWKKPAGELPTDEGPMIQWVFDQSRSDAIAKDQVELVYAGIDKDRKRATTKTTAEEWLKTNPKDGLYLAVSIQPFNIYQKLVLEDALLQNKRPGIRIEVIGDAPAERSYGLRRTNPDHLNKYAAIALDNIARICYELVAIQNL
ncbi:hypothetical protein [Candidatus Finniella inopinata]|uniref:Uncharacterized protein n=1 Tax=Candidatus Finniella inopinata TaxID=1696036 RepID=A0A4Q7DH76_9PROT|nr:hypothetical protein [Candidatus Finniella inopinata]RZI45670.1 hypothetical protein EQU50_06100 [Candidatus Finniella inopinata]